MPTLFEFGLFANRLPVFVPYVFVDLNWDIAHIEAVGSVATRTGYPVLVATVHFAVVGLESVPL
jgi:hypothetical protein